jgi:hypothetical protein
VGHTRDLYYVSAGHHLYYGARRRVDPHGSDIPVGTAARFFTVAADQRGPSACERC